ncbi:Vacuolar protein sorting-associated protein 16 [Malassezia cuniculi]|uniref:Probable vacuolar protein sorting-associated protein 16 homolog n=1 Tax=Malassezia cuniculi TaxID=948313 RepID=A0AAF0EQT5_9BASI|nr:Vacuolar protein sorting-associated protein 16 [Malassezia cuniculi]
MLEPWRPSADWHQLSDTLYRRTRQYELAWPHTRLDEFLVAVSSSGSLIALVRDPGQFVAVRDEGALLPQIRVYTGAGQLLETIPWENGGVIVAIGFTWRDELAVVLDDGHVLLYALLEPCPALSDANAHEATPSTHYRRFELGSDATDVGINSARVLPTRIVACTHGGSFVDWELPGVHEDVTPSPWNPPAGSSAPVALPQISEPPLSWTAAGPSTAGGGTTTVLAATKDALLSISADEVTDLYMPDKYAAVRISPSGRLLALVTRDARLIVVGADLTRRLREWSIPQKGTGGIADTGARAIEWCGDNVVALAWTSELALVGPDSAPLVLPLVGTAHIQGDAGGLRVVSADAHEYIEPVQTASANALRPGSTHPAAILLEASHQAHQSDPHAYEAVRAIEGELASAVDTCVAAAAVEWEAHSQRTLLKAALFGKAFLDAYDSKVLLETARNLRVLNAVRDYSVGIPANMLDTDALLYRLSMRHMHLMAVRICAFLGRSAESVLQHWARTKIAYSRPTALQVASTDALAHSEEQLANTIISRFKSSGSVCYADIAWTAWQAGRARLATLLVEHEVRAVDQVPLLLRMREHRRALNTAVASGDTDLIYHVLFRLREQLASGDFFRYIHAAASEATDVLAPNSVYRTLAADLLEVYALEQDRELARDYYFQDDRREALAMMDVNARHGGSGGAAADLEDRIASLRSAAKHFGDARARAAEVKQCEDEASLLGFQSALEKEIGGLSLTGLSLVATIKVCIQKRLDRQADRLRSEFRVSDKRMSYIRIAALADAHDYAALRELSLKRSSIGYLPFVRQLVNAGALDEACTYYLYPTVPERRAKEA